MWRRKKNKIVPQADQYISQRYEDTAVRIFLNIKEGKGLYSTYVPWIQAMIVQYIPIGTMRAKYWMEQVPLYTSSVVLGGERIAKSNINSTTIYGTTEDSENSQDNAPRPQASLQPLSITCNDQPLMGDPSLVPAMQHSMIHEKISMDEPTLDCPSEVTNRTTKLSHDDINTSKYCVIL